MEKKPEPLIQVDLGENGGKVVFFSIDEAAQWVNKEQTYWNWFSKQAGQDSGLQETWNRISHFLSALNQTIDQGRRNAADPQWGGHTRILEQQITEAFKNGGRNVLLHSSSARAKFIEELVAAAPLAAAYAVAYFMGFNINARPLQSLALKGLISAFLFDEGLLEMGARDNAKAAINALNGIQSEWGVLTGTLKTDVAAIKNQFVDLKKKTETLLEEQGKAHTLLVTTKEAEFSTEIENGKKKLKGIEEAYNAHMQLQAPVEYWKGEETRHQDAAKSYGRKAAGFGAFSLVAVAFTLWVVVGNETVLGKVPLWRLGALLTVVAGIVWISRILVRMYLSHAHLATDAGERVAMAKTYLALVRDGKVTDEKDRRVILDALFRKASTGIVKDDGAPPTPFEVITRQR